MHKTSEPNWEETILCVDCGGLHKVSSNSGGLLISVDPCPATEEMPEEDGE